MSVVNGQKVNSSVTNAAFISRLTDSNTVAVVDLENTDAASGSSVFNIQREHNSIASFVGKALNDTFDAKPAWLSDIVGVANESIKDRVDAIVAMFNSDELIGHTHDGTDGQGPKVRYTNLNTPQSNNGSLGNIDALPTADLFTVRLTGAGTVTLRGLDDGAEGRVVTVMNITGNTLTVLNDDSNPSVEDKIVTGTGDDLEIQDGGAVSFQYDNTALVWRVVSGAGGKNTGAYQECPAGAINGVNTTFGPLTFTPTNEESVAVFVDGVKLESPDHYTYDSGTNTVEMVDPPQPGQDVCVYYLFTTTSSTITIVGSGTTPRTEYRTLVAGDITAAEITLAETPDSPGEVMLDIIGGGPQEITVDFAVSGNTLSWSGLALDGVLVAGDKLRVYYWY
jgi:hypothetical protein